MSINAKPPRDDQQDRSSFVDRATEVETAKLQCWIPAELHQWLKFKAVADRSNMTALVVEALQDYRRGRRDR